MELNKEEGGQSSLGRHIHLFQLTGQCHQAQEPFHTLRTAERYTDI